MHSKQFTLVAAAVLSGLISGLGASLFLHGGRSADAAPQDAPKWTVPIQEQKVYEGDERMVMPRWSMDGKECRVLVYGNTGKQFYIVNGKKGGEYDSIGGVSQFSVNDTLTYTALSRADKAWYLIQGEKKTKLNVDPSIPGLRLYLTADGKHAGWFSKEGNTHWWRVQKLD